MENLEKKLAGGIGQRGMRGWSGPVVNDKLLLFTVGVCCRSAKQAPQLGGHAAKGLFLLLDFLPNAGRRGIVSVLLATSTQLDVIDHLGGKVLCLDELVQVLCVHVKQDLGPGTR